MRDGFSLSTAPSHLTLRPGRGVAAHIQRRCRADRHTVLRTSSRKECLIQAATCVTACHLQEQTHAYHENHSMWRSLQLAIAAGTLCLVGSVPDEQLLCQVPDLRRVSAAQHVTHRVSPMQVVGTSPALGSSGSDSDTLENIPDELTSPSTVSGTSMRWHTAIIRCRAPLGPCT